MDDRDFPETITLSLPPSPRHLVELDPRISIFCDWHPNAPFFCAAQGEHYKLLAHLTQQLPPGSTVADIGTYLGYSAIALSAGNPSVKVVTYDIIDHVSAQAPKYAITYKKIPLIEFRQRNLLEDIDECAFVANLPLAVLDVDPHDGIKETRIVATLKNAGFRGALICDDIYLNPAMVDFWTNQIPSDVRKIDVTAYGHSISGTGILFFDTTYVSMQ